MEVLIISAVAKNGVIGKDNTLPWHYPEDFKRFKTLTSGHAVVMGRKTYESLGRPLPKRLNIVLSRREDLEIEGCVVACSLEEAKKICAEKNEEQMWIIGGSGIYAEGLKIADVLELTEVHKEFDGDVYFPSWDTMLWKEVFREKHEEYDFVRYERA
jgi:dihydrofolate reductase